MKTEGFTVKGFKMGNPDVEFGTIDGMSVDELEVIRGNFYDLVKETGKNYSLSTDSSPETGVCYRLSISQDNRQLKRFDISDHKNGKEMFLSVMFFISDLRKGK